MSSRSASISGTVPIKPAIAHAKRMLFQPFDPGKWFVIGFCAWLAHLGEGGFGGNFGSGWHRRGGDFTGGWEHAKDYLLNNLYWIVPLGAAVVAFGVAVGLVVLWLNSRGRFMFLHCVACDKAEISEPWKQFARAGNSLFWFRLVIGLIGLVLVVPLLVLAGVTVYQLLEHNTSWLVGGAQLAGTTLVLLGLAIVIGAIVLGAVLATCCIAGCLLLIPYLGTVMLLPILVFERSYALYYLAQYGAEFDVFPPPGPPVTDVPPGAI